MPPNGKFGKPSTQKCLGREMLVSRRVYHWLSSDGPVELVVFVCEISWLVPSVYRLPTMISMRIICNHQIIMNCTHCKIFDVNILKFPKRVLTGYEGDAILFHPTHATVLGVVGLPSSHSFQKDNDYGWSTYLTHPPFGNKGLIFGLGNQWF